MKALILIDFINLIVGMNKLEEDFFKRLSQTVKKAREEGFLIIHVKVGFSNNYIEVPNNSPLFGRIKENGVMKFGTESTDFYNKNDVEENDVIIEKSRVSAFYSTKLDLVLRTNDVKEVFIAGIATDLTVTHTSRDAHDRNYSVTVLGDLCASQSIENHEAELRILSRIASVKNSGEVFN